MSDMLTAQERSELYNKIFAIKKHNEFAQFGTWIFDHQLMGGSGLDYSECRGRLLLKSRAVLDIEYRIYNVIMVSRSPLKVDGDVQVHSIRQVAGVIE